LADLLDLIRRTPHLDWLLLTKRPEKWRHRIEAALATVSEKPDAFTCDSAANSEWWNLRCWLDGDPPLNVWIGATVEDRQRAEDRIPKLLAIPTKLRFLSCEPLLGSLDLTRVTFPTGVAENVLRHQTDGTIIVPIAGVHWIIAGGESGPNARPMHPDWPRCLRDQCATANIPFHFKQWGEWLPVSQWVDAVSDIDPDDWNHLPQFIFPESFGVISHRCGKHRAGRLLDGVLHDAVPSV
jgi:protein gp37